MIRRLAEVLAVAALALAACSSTPHPSDGGGCTPACGANANCVNGACQCNQNFTSCAGSGDGGSSCVSLQSDSLNCGACGKACAGASTCLGGTCQCSGTSTQCAAADGGAICTDLSSDPANCGNCGVACPANQSCQGDLCVCESPNTTCQLPDSGQVCADFSTDNFNCGGCGVLCDPTTQQCQAATVGVPGTCECKVGTQLCDGGCVDLATDLGNCGGCGQLCATGLCSGGSCDCSDVDAGFKLCGRSCVNLETDVTNCGSCGTDCTQLAPGLAGVSCVSGVCKCGNGLEDICTSPQLACVDLSNTPSHCGSCGQDCTQQPVTTDCVNGQCACPNGGENCNGVCEALTTDPANCGACNNVCSSSFAAASSCRGGHCACLDTQTLCLGTAPDPLNPSCTCLDNTGSGCTQPQLTFTADVFPLLSQTGRLGCAASGCHAGPAAAAGLDFTSVLSAYQGLVSGDGGLYGSCDGGPNGAPGNLPSLACPCLARVAPGKPESSILVDMLTNNTSSLCPGALPMPIDADGGYHALSGCEIQQISVWISQGAKQ